MPTLVNKATNSSCDDMVVVAFFRVRLVNWGAPSSVEIRGMCGGHEGRKMLGMISIVYG